jgi:Zn-dependent peptidase ImmA (M78 family)/DNA-binding XRE family transcriptional regulator
MSIDLARAYAGLFDPFRLRIAREFKGLRKTELAKRIGVTPAALTQYESGASKPSPATLVKLAFTLGQSIEFFAQDGRRQKLSDHGRAFFRSLRSTRQLDRDRAEARAFLASEVVDGLRRHVKLPVLNIPESLHVGEDATQEAIERRAEQLREYWGMAPGPVPNMVRLLEANGVIVTRCSIECAGVDAFSRWFRPGPLVVLNSDREHVDRLRFDAAHELGHLVLHAEVEPGNAILEKQAHMFAAAFLMPRAIICEQLPMRFDMAAFGRLKQMWGVSVAALLRRARDLGRLSDATYRRAVITMSQMGEHTNERSFPIHGGAERSILLSKAVEILQAKGYTLADLARDTRLPETFVMETVHDDEGDSRPVVPLSPFDDTSSSSMI